MIQRDYLMRLIETVGQLLIALRKRLLGGEVTPEEAAEEIHAAADRAGMDLHFLCSVHEETLLMLMSPGGEPEPGRVWITAELFLVDGQRCLLEDDPMGALARFQRALLLYRLMDPDTVVGRGFPEVSERIREVEALLPDAPPGV